MTVTIVGLEAEVVRLRAQLAVVERQENGALAELCASNERIAQLEAALLRLGLSWEDADVHPRCGAGTCKSCDEAWAAYSLVLGPTTQDAQELKCERCGGSGKLSAKDGRYTWSCPSCRGANVSE